MRTAFSLLALAALLLTRHDVVLTQQTVQEPSTEKVFPAEVTFKAGETSYTLKATGTSVRKKVIIKVYGMVHYLQDPPRCSEAEAFRTILKDGKAKQITMAFVRDVTVDQIRGAYRDGFEANATDAEKKEIAPYIETFLSNFDAEVKENQQFVLRWFPGGKIVPIINNVEKSPIVNATFARVLWTIWFGEDSIVDRDDLVQFMIP